MTSSKAPNPPKRHHFIPQFLLKQWAGDDDKMLHSYWLREDASLGMDRYPPKSVACEDWLYETTGFPPQHAQQMEDKFFKPLDTRASNVLPYLTGGRLSELSDQMTCDWARFVMSIWFRTPNDVKGLQKVVEALASPAISEEVLGLSIPEGFPDGALSQLTMEAVRQAIDNEERGTALLNMQWAVLTSPGEHRYMISDWPLDTAKDLPFLGHEKSYITLPISPRHLFIAAPSMAFLRAIGNLEQGEIEHRQNYATVSQARRFVGSIDNRYEAFVRLHFGSEGRPSIAKSLADAWNVPI